MKDFREPVLKRFKLIGLTENTYKILRKQKLKQKKSMMQLIEDLVNKQYGETRLLEVPAETAGEE